MSCLIRHAVHNLLAEEGPNSPTHLKHEEVSEDAAGAAQIGVHRRESAAKTHPPKAPSRSAIKSATSSTPTDSRTSVSEIPSAARCAGGTDACVMIAGCSIRLSTPPRLSASAKIRHRSRKRRDSSRPPFSNRRDHAAEAVHLPLRKLMLRMRRKPGIDHALDRRMALEPLRERQRVLAMALASEDAVSSGREAPGTNRTDPRSRPTAFCRNASRSHIGVIARHRRCRR